MTAFSLRDKVVLITGAAAGLGRETARVLHERGAVLVLVDRDAAVQEAARELGDRAVAHTVDVTDAAAMHGVVEDTVARHGRLDVCIAGAGIAPAFHTVRAIDEAVFERVLDVNLNGVWHTVRPALDPIVASGGQVVVISSIYAWTNGVATASYAVAKAGIEQLARALRVELAPHGATSMVVHYGAIDTGMVRGVFADPIADAIRSWLPEFVMRTIPVSAAAHALVEGLERRAPRVILPRWWRVAFVLRGILGPLSDRLLARDRRMREIVLRADGPSPTPPPASDLDALRVADDQLWVEGPPHETFARLRRECPVHWSEGITQSPTDAGFWSVTRAEDIHAVSRDWETFSSAHNVLVSDAIVPLELIQGMMIGMDPPKHDRFKALFQKGFTPRAIERHEAAIEATTTSVLDGLEGRDTCDLVSDVAQPVVSRVIGSFMGLAPEDDEPWATAIGALLGVGDPALNPKGPEALLTEDVPAMGARCMALAAERRAEPGEDLLSVLVAAEVDGDRLTDEEIFSGFVQLLAAGTDSTKATYCSAMRALIEDPEQRRLLIDDPTLVPGAVEEALRMYPAFAHFRRTATRDTQIGGQRVREGDKVVLWYPSSNRDEARYEDPDRFDVRRDPEHQAFGAGGRHFCMGSALARIELRILIDQTIRRFPDMTLDGEPTYVLSQFTNQLRTLPVRLRA